MFCCFKCHAELKQRAPLARNAALTEKLLDMMLHNKRATHTHISFVWQNVVVVVSVGLPSTSAVFHVNTGAANIAVFI